MTKTHPETNNFQEILNNISMNLVFDKLAVFFNDKKKIFQIETELLNEKYFFMSKFLILN